MKDFSKLNRIKGCLIGLAIGDAVGVHLEYTKPGTFEPIHGYREGNPYSIPLGYWTDDTSMALCMANSLIEKKGFYPEDIMEKFCQWQRKGYMSSTGECFDIGGTTRQALMSYWREPNLGPYRGLTDVLSAGNGSIMRLAPIPMFFHNNVVDAIAFAERSSRITHGYIDCVDGCRLLSELIYRLLNDQPIFNILDSVVIEKKVITIQDKLTPKINAIVEGSFFKKDASQIKGSGYVVDSLEASLWALLNTESFEEAVLKAVNLGDDADTTGAVTGQLAGAYYGYDKIPQHLKDGLYNHDMILETAEQLYEISLQLINK